MPTLAAKRKCQKLHCSLVSSVASAPQFRYRTRLSGLRSLCLFDGVDQRRADIRSGALHDERNVLVGDGLERDQRLGRLRLVVEGHQLEFAAQRAALGIDVVDDVLQLLADSDRPTCANGPDSGSV